jgi:hypothetical protein
MVANYAHHGSRPMYWILHQMYNGEHNHQTDQANVVTHTVGQEHTFQILIPQQYMQYTLQYTLQYTDSSLLK